MRLCCPGDMADDAMALCCRQSRLVGIFQTVVWCIVLAVPIVLGSATRMWWLFWLGVIIATLLFPLIVKNLLLLFRATNWVMRMGRDGLWINLLSYRDRPTSAPSVVHLNYDEVVSAGKHVERYSTPSKIATSDSEGPVGGTTIWRSEFLQIQLREARGAELQAALNMLRYQSNTLGEQAHISPAASRPYPFWVTSETVIRIPWLSGHAHTVLPRLSSLLDQLGTYMMIADATERDRPNWRKLIPDDSRELARELVLFYGDDIAAANVLVRAAGLTSADAMTLTKQFAREGN